MHHQVRNRLLGGYFLMLSLAIGTVLVFYLAPPGVADEIGSALLVATVIMTIGFPTLFEQVSRLEDHYEAERTRRFDLERRIDEMREARGQ